MQNRARAGLLSLILLSAPASAGAELMIEKVQWQLARPIKGQPRRYEDISEISAAPPKVNGKLRARVTLKNRGPKAVEGILLRFSVAARLAPIHDGESGGWAVPMLIEARRVPKVGANQFFDVSLDPAPMLDLYLKKVARSGFWPDQFRLQVMLEPHKGAVDAIRTIESLLPVTR